MSNKLVLAVVLAGALAIPALADGKAKEGGSQELLQSMMSGMVKMHDMKMSGNGVASYGLGHSCTP
jgi:hypothetical protein